MPGIVDVAQAIAALQPQYSPDNTQPMSERGRLIRHELTAQLRALEPMLAPALGEFGADFLVDGSDGIGRKTEAPWVRFASRRMSPTPRDGFYVVMHFSADGSAFWVTVGCGSTVWNGGDLRSLPEAELNRRTNWAREIIAQRFGSIEPFTDEIVLGAKAPLPRTFERATALAKRFDPMDGDEAAVEDTLRRAANFLAEIYRNQRTGAHLSPAQVAEMEVEELSRPNRHVLRGQGIGLTPEERQAVELRAMDVARTWLEGHGYAVVDRSATSPFDFEASRGPERIKVEVKGTTCAACDEFIMTRNEVELHRREAGATALFLVAGIRISKNADGASVGEGGTCEACVTWDINAWALDPMAYRLRRVPA
jgi:hypothetical protein